MPRFNRGGRPGLLGMAARTAVVAGTATAVSGAVAQRQQARAAEHQAAQQQMQNSSVPEVAAPVPVPVPAPASTGPATDVVAQLQQLGELHRQGLLTAEEFALAKQQLLGG